MELEAFRRWTQRLLDNLAPDERVIGVVMLGSAAETRRAPDAWSDHDFFVITQPGMQEPLRQKLDWLPDADQMVLRPRETEHGLKVLFADGHIIEFAVFDMSELHYARVNDWRVLREPADGSISAALRDLEARDAAPPPFDQAREIELLLSLIVIGGGRVARGEIISGAEFIKEFALAAYLRLLVHQVTPAPGSVLDNLNPYRRVEQGYPQIAPRLHAALLLPPLAAAAALLDLTEDTLHSIPPAALTVVRREIERAKQSLAT